MGPGSVSRPSARVQRFGDATLSNTTYDVQGRRYAVSQDLTLNTMITVAASVWIPSDWVSATQNAGTCYLASGNAAQGQACARYLDFGVELGLDSGGKPASIERLGVRRLARIKASSDMPAPAPRLAIDA